MEAEVARKVLTSAVESARNAGLSETEIEELVFGRKAAPAPASAPLSGLVPGQQYKAGEVVTLSDGQTYAIGEDLMGVPDEATSDIETGEPAQEELRDEPRVIQCDTEIAKFSDGTAVLRQRAYLNAAFKPYRAAHMILQPDVFRTVFKVGTYLSDAIAGYQNPPEVLIDGDPGDPRSRMAKP